MMQMQGLWNRAFLLCLFHNFFLFMYYFAMLTILPIYILQDLGGSVVQAGLALTLFLVSSIGIRPFSGLIVERLGQTRAQRGAGILFVLFAFSHLWIDSLWSLLLIRFLHGFWFSILTTVNVPIVNHFIPTDRKGAGMGYFVMSTNLGVVFGPFIALSLISVLSFNQIFGALAALTLIGFVFSLSLKVPKTEPIQSSHSGLQWSDIIEKRAIPIGLIALLTAFAYSSITSFITAFTQTKDLLAYAGIFFIVFAVSMIVVRPWVGKFYDQKGPSYVIYPSFLAFAFGLIVVGFVDNQWTLWLSAVLIGIGYGSLFPCMQTLAIQSVESQRMGHAISTFFTLFDLGLAIGSVVMGLLIAQIDYAMTYWFCAAVVVLTLILYRTHIASPVLKQ